jgi:magnesium transporter
MRRTRSRQIVVPSADGEPGAMPSRAAFRVLDVPLEGSGGVAHRVGSSQGVAPPPPGVLRWIDLAEQDGEALRLLGERFGFHPLALEDCAHFDQRPKLEEYGAYLFIVVHGLACAAGHADEVGVREVHAFLGKDYLVTVHSDPVDALEVVWKRVAGDAALARRGMDFVYYQLSDAIVDANFPILDGVADEIEAIENRVLDRPQRSDLARIFELRQTLITMRRVLSPQRDVFALLAKRGDSRIGERTAPYFRDVYDHLVRIHESIDGGRDLLTSALDAYLSMVGNRTNDIMKRLTLLSSIFLPLTFITGFFGQNFDHLPFGSDALLIGMVVSCVAIPAGMLLWFYRSNWL